MGWFWALSIFFVVLIAGSFWSGYLTEEQMLGREAARRNSRDAITLFLFFLLPGFALIYVVQLLGSYGWVTFHILYAVAISAWWISWFFRKQKAGFLLADAGRSPQSKFLFWLGLIEVAFLVFVTWLFLRPALNETPEYVSLEALSRLVYWWSIVSFCLALGLNKLEFRENGICYMYSLMRWQRINSYTWETDKSNVLTIRFKPRFPLLPNFTSLAIPVKHKEMVSRILAEQLPGKRL
ncbi:MAG: hypothetical protein KME12_24255 [Trichocoleus desertorum ATA4-8-CV12]|jgi:hypothetical protein|nr:hypothetical protein [Trichocoleus desertorum ATA4-8-CV12]